MFSDPEVKNSSALMFDHKEDEQHPHLDRWHGEEVNGDDFPDVILEERFRAFAIRHECASHATRDLFMP
jgi:hypothetical protein